MANKRINNVGQRMAGYIYYNICQQKLTSEVSLQWPTNELTMSAKEWQVILQHLSGKSNKLGLITMANQ